MSKELTYVCDMMHSKIAFAARSDFHCFVNFMATE
eukprot:UN05424